MRINATGKYYTDLNHEVKKTQDREVVIDHCLGQRYIGTGVTGKNIIIHGTPGNALGAYLKGTDLTVFGNVQDAVGDTMDSGKIIVHGSGGDSDSRLLMIDKEAPNAAGQPAAFRRRY